MTVDVGVDAVGYFAVMGVELVGLCVVSVALWFALRAVVDAVRPGLLARVSDALFPLPEGR